MGTQLKLFQPNEEHAKIRELLQSDSYHELGIELALKNGFNKVDILIQLYRKHLKSINFDAWFNRTTAAHDLVEFELFGCVWYLIELDGDAFYLQAERGEKVETSTKIYEWKENDKWGDFDLSNIIAKHIKENRPTYDRIVKNKTPF